ncbi:nitrate ABC transporter permease [Burkholderia sp. SRS-W-2-2016]|uniref:ABC transporter permease n=1 Tax=Burkholderia sp. SRS-W-2-2016 TaxID=1926878 RepID=UPI00094AB593|nr:ABC transporter permease subunit [Burkholderia sp. SRS-W-2-2016]OLL29223.1 nitrate ABC transporter permease [Burkholderia sp. SRS-W-2-2016]
MSVAARWRIGIVVALVALLELVTRMAWINPVSFIPPSAMLASAWSLLVSGQYTSDIVQTLGTALLAVLLAVVFGFIGGVVLFRLPRLRRVLDPLLLSYYAVPVFVLYPILIVIFGLNRWPLVGIGFIFAVVAMAVNTLNGLERVPRVMLRTAKVCRMSALQEIRLITLPASLPYVFTGIKLTVVYAFIAVVAGEFVLSGSGFGYQIAFAYNAFDNPTMYGLMVLMLVFVATLNGLLRAAETRLYRRIRREAA